MSKGKFEKVKKGVKIGNLQGYKGTDVGFSEHNFFIDSEDFFMEREVKIFSKAKGTQRIQG